tara:strand:+ start:1068 stop:1202 length:135 start_codon:yes stop_codon:yes gene_type:complete
MFNAKMPEEAINYFKEVIRMRPGFTPAQKNLKTSLSPIGVQVLF